MAEFTLANRIEHSEAAPRIERTLLMLAGLFILMNFASLMVSRETGIMTLLPVGVWAVCAFAGVRLLDRYLPARDPLLYSIAMFLCGWGLVIIDRLVPFFADRQTNWLIVSVIAMLLTASFPYVLDWLRRYRYLLLILGIGLLVSTILFGQNPSGDPTAPQLWLGFGSIFFQPSEALKIILVAFLASYLGEQYPIMRAKTIQLTQGQSWLSPRILGPILLMWGLSVIVVVWQRDLGTAVLFFAVFLVLLYVASGYSSILIGGAALIVIAAVIAYTQFGVVQLRVDIWLNPWPEADGRAYQIVQSLMAFAAGGVFGQGVAQGSPGYIPVVHSDFVFAALAEEWGLLGVVVIVACMAIFVMRGLRIALMNQSRPFYAFLSVGLSLLIGGQSLLIMGGVLKLIPLTGVTLPFLSYGGSSLLTSFIIMGLLLRLSASENR